MYKMPGAGVGVAGGSVGTLASTGADIGWWLAVGVLLVVLGAVAVIAAYRRNRRLARTRGQRG
jgi:LPXTG-motif cell wall-anchored protein